MKALFSSGRRRIGSSKSPAIPRRAAAQIIFKWQPRRIYFYHDNDDDDREYDQAQPRGSDAVAVAIKAAKTATMVGVVAAIMCDPIM